MNTGLIYDYIFYMLLSLLYIIFLIVLGIGSVMKIRSTQTSVSNYVPNFYVLLGFILTILESTSGFG